MEANGEKRLGVIYALILVYRGDWYYYIGMTRHKLKRRIMNHIGKLNRNTHPNSKMQMLYDMIKNETEVEPLVMRYIIEADYYTEEELVVKEEYYTNQYIKEYGDFVLNINIGNKHSAHTIDAMKRTKGRPKSRRHASKATAKHFKDKTVRDAHSTKLKRVLSNPTIKYKLSLNNANATPVTIDGVTYRSRRVAIRETGLSKYKVMQLERSQNPDRVRRVTNKKRAVVLDGVSYPSIAAAARALDRSPGAIRARLKNIM